MGSRDEREERRGIVDNLIDTLRRALGLPSLVEIVPRIPEADVAGVPQWVPGPVRPVDMRPAGGIDGGAATLETASAVPGDLDLSGQVVCTPPPSETVSVSGPVPLELTAGVRQPEGTLEPVAVRALGDGLEVACIEPNGVRPSVPPPAVSAVRARPKTVSVLRRPLRSACGVVAANEVAAALPVRRRALSHIRGHGAGLAAGMRALVRLSGLAPRDIRWQGFYGPLPDAEPARMEVDADSGCLLIWYARGAAAKATLTLAVGRRSQDGTLIAARFPQ
ncbi:MAG TPA: hypothetical protein PLD23_20130 [Armatimonadota bacterium]|nr:hypothetical protein [Armatimonadota bacterium]